MDIKKETCHENKFVLLKLSCFSNKNGVLYEINNPISGLILCGKGNIWKEKIKLKKKS